MTKAISTPTTRANGVERATAPAPLEARFVRLADRIAVTFAKPVEHGRPEKITGDLLGTMYARGNVHHYRIAADAVVWIVPPIWLTPASRKAVAMIALPESDQVRKLRLVREFADAIGVTL